MNPQRLVIAGLVLLAVGCAAGEPSPPPETAAVGSSVKKSSRGICHEPGTRDYSATSHFEAFLTVDECLKSGGRLPAAKGRKSLEIASIRMSQNKVCHSRASPNYGALEDYVTFESMEACVAAGGRKYK